MNNTAKITIGILIVAVGFLLVFAKIKTNEANKYYQETENLRVKVEKTTVTAEKLAARALETQNRAEHWHQYSKQLMEQLRSCKGSK